MTRHQPAPRPRSRHGDRIERVRAHVRANLGGDLSLDALAEVACLSRFHFHRVWRAHTGETVWDAVRRERLNRAALLLAGTDRPVAAVARLAGFADADALGRAFRGAFGLSPRAVRARGLPLAALLPPRLQQEDASPMTPATDAAIRDEPPVELAALLHRGPYPEIGRAFGELMVRLDRAGLRPAGPAVAINYDDPDAVPAAELRAHAGVEVRPAGASLPDGVERVAVPGGRSAVLVHRGSYAGLPEPWRAIYRWIAAAGEATGDAPPYERYLNNPEEVGEDELLTEIVVPLRG